MIMLISSYIIIRCYFLSALHTYVKINTVHRDMKIHTLVVWILCLFSGSIVKTRFPLGFFVWREGDYV